MSIIEHLQRTSWVNYDFESHPEALLTVTGFTSILEFMDREAMPGVGTLSVDETALSIIENRKNSQEDTIACMKGIEKATLLIEEQVRSIETNCPEAMAGGSIECALLDLKCWGYLGRYYIQKLGAALDLCCYRYSGESSYRKSAISKLKAAIKPFENLAVIWSSHYMPYKMVRSKYIFGYTYYIDEVKKDIRLAENIDFNRS